MCKRALRVRVRENIFTAVRFFFIKKSRENNVDDDDSRRLAHLVMTSATRKTNGVAELCHNPQDWEGREGEKFFAGDKRP